MNNLRLECIDPSNLTLSQPGMQNMSPMSSGSPKTPTSIHSPISAMNVSNLFKLPSNESPTPSTILTAMQTYPMMVMNKPNPQENTTSVHTILDDNLPKDLSCPTDNSASVSG
jgi:hypothetical protein